MIVLKKIIRFLFMMALLSGVSVFFVGVILYPIYPISWKVVDIFMRAYVWTLVSMIAVSILVLSLRFLCGAIKNVWIRLDE